MDPNANLKEQREIIAELSKPFECHDEEGLDLLQRLAELGEELDKWLSKGGALPDEWLRVAEEDVFKIITRTLEANESRCCDNYDDRRYLAACLVMSLVKS